MKRKLENLAQKRQTQQDKFTQAIAETKQRLAALKDLSPSPKNNQGITPVEKIPAPSEMMPPKKRKFPYTRSAGATPKPTSQDLIHERLWQAVEETQERFAASVRLAEESFASLLKVSETLAALMDAKDKEWDALGSNHVGMIFKSLEWRVDQLEAEYKDAGLLMRRFLDLKEKLNQLISTLGERKIPSPGIVGELIRPLEDWRYTGFENRFRGSEKRVKSQMEKYLPHFQKGGPVIDLGCGRGEFLELLKERGIAARGIDIDEQMILLCREKGLDCERGDILEKLAEFGDESLAGFFSSQVIEHLPPAYLKRLIELAYFKLSPGSPIVLETVNSTSVFALVQIYHLDLSHERPVHPQALKFLLESSGFSEVKIQYSEPLEEEMLKTLPGADDRTSLLNENIDRLNKLLYSPANYAAIAFKK